VIVNVPAKSAEIAQFIPPADGGASLKVYPNPFNNTLHFEFISPVNVNARIEIFDMNGRLVTTLLDKPVKAGVDNTVDYNPGDMISGLYVYRVILGDKVFTDKVMYNK
jgi:hypothetical protein